MHKIKYPPLLVASLVTALVTLLALGPVSAAGHRLQSLSRPASGPNNPPVAQPDTLGTFRDMAVSVSTGDLLANDSDPDGDVILVLSVTPGNGPNSGGVTLNGATVTYTPSSGYIGQDNFTYTIGDGRGGQASTYVTVTIGDQSSFRITSIKNTPTETDVKGTAIPGSYCIIQISDNVNGLYQDFTGEFQPAPDGTFELHDITSPHPTERFYRVRLSN